MQLTELLKHIDYSCSDRPVSLNIKGIAYDSRQVKKGYLFVSIKGMKADGHEFIPQAVKNGAVAIVCEREVEKIPGVFYVKTDDGRRSLALLAAAFYGFPAEKMKVIGVTGTNGKTTITHMLQAIYEEDNRPYGLMGTLYAKCGSNIVDLGHTTPESLEIQKFFAECLEQGAEHIIMEVSSHALNMRRVVGIDFYGAIFSNLTQDHLDFHDNMLDYRNAKLKLFENLSNRDDAISVINKDDEWSSDFIEASPVRAITYGLLEDADVRAFDIVKTPFGTTFKVRADNKEFQIEMKLIGNFNIYNALAAIAFAIQEGIDIDIIKKGLANLSGVSGRLEKVECNQDFSVIVDYAHTPDGLRNILETIREISNNRIITVFGCGGDRDRSKRPLMGEIAAEHSDFTIITSDNPRSEDPEKIIADIIPGVEKIKDSRFAIIIDRYEAIHHAINLARSHDFIIIAGKGHEDYQLINGVKTDFDDRKIAEELLRGRLNSEAHN